MVGIGCGLSTQTGCKIGAQCISHSSLASYQAPTKAQFQRGDRLNGRHMFDWHDHSWAFETRLYIIITYPTSCIVYYPSTMLVSSFKRDQTAP